MLVWAVKLRLAEGKAGGRISDFLVCIGLRLKDRAVAQHLEPGSDGALQVHTPSAS